MQTDEAFISNRKIKSLGDIVRNEQGVHFMIHYLDDSESYDFWVRPQANTLRVETTAHGIVFVGSSDPFTFGNHVDAERMARRERDRLAKAWNLKVH